MGKSWDEFGTWMVEMAKEPRCKECPIYDACYEDTCVTVRDAAAAFEVEVEQ